MLLSYDRPTDIACSLDGTAAWLSDDQGAYLTNGRPNIKTRLSWITGAQTTSSETVIEATWGVPIVPRIVALIGVSLPLGLKVTVDFHQSGTWGNNTQTAYVQQMSNDTNGVWLVFPTGIPASDGVKVHMLNDVSSVAVIAGGAVVDIGELWIGSSATWVILRTVKDDYTDSTERRRTLGQQIFTTRRLPYRKIALDMYPTLDSSVDAVRIMRALSSQSVPAVMILRHERLNASLFGNVTGFSITDSDGAYLQASISFEEVPNG